MQAYFSLPASKWNWLVMLAALCCLSCSSGEKLNPVQGKVLYRDKPLGGILVTFHPKGPHDIKTIMPVGLTKEDGSFTVITGQTEGARAGEYVLTFICSEEVPVKGKKLISTALPDTVDRLQGAYSNATTSTFKVEIKNGPNQLEPFHLK